MLAFQHATIEADKAIVEKQMAHNQPAIARHISRPTILITGLSYRGTGIAAAVLRTAGVHVFRYENLSHSAQSAKTIRDPSSVRAWAADLGQKYEQLALEVPHLHRSIAQHEIPALWEPRVIVVTSDPSTTNIPF